MPKQSTVRLPDDLAAQAEAVARVTDTSINQLIVDALTAHIEAVRRNDEFTTRANELIEADQELLRRLAR